MKADNKRYENYKDGSDDYVANEPERFILSKLVKFWEIWSNLEEKKTTNLQWRTKEMHDDTRTNEIFSGVDKLSRSSILKVMFNNSIFWPL